MAASSIFRYAPPAVTGNSAGSAGMTVPVFTGDIFIAFAYNNSTTGSSLPTLFFSGVAQTLTLIGTASAGAAPIVRAYVASGTPTGTQQIDFGYNISGGTQATVAWYQISGNAIVQDFATNNGTGNTASWALSTAPKNGWLTLLGLGTTSTVAGSFGGGNWTTNGATTQFDSSVSNDNPPPQNAARGFGSSQTWSGIYLTVGEPRYDVIGPTFPTSASTTGGSTTWSNVSNVLTSDNLVATVVPAVTNTSNTYIDVTGFNLNVPNIGSLYGIVAEVEARTDGAAVIDSIQLLQGGTTIGTAYSPGTTMTSTEAVYAFANGLWGASLTAAVVNASDFGVRIRFKAGTTYFANSNYPATATSAGGAVPWVNPSNATVDDGTTATQVSIAAASNDYLKLTNFGFNLPTNANVTDIYTFFNRRRSGGTLGNVSTNVHQLCYNNALISTNMGSSGNWTTSLTSEYGYFTPSISAANVNDPSFGMWIRTAGVGGNSTTSAVFATGAASVGSGIAWTNPANAKASDSTYATFLLNGTTATTLSNHQGLSLTGYGFSIPTNATIVGIVASIRRIQVGSTGAGSVRTGTVQFMKAGVPGGTNLATTTAFTTTVTAANFGTASSLSGQTFTPADINDPNFGVYIQLQGALASASRTGGIDSASIAVTYSLPSDRIAEVDSGQIQVYYNAADTNQVTYVDSIRLYAQTQGAPLFQFGLSESQQVSAQLARQRGFATTVSEAMAYAFALSVESSIVPVLFAFNVVEMEAVAVQMMRNRGFNPTVAEVESIVVAAMARGRKLATALAENETISIVSARKRNLPVVIAETELMTVALMRIRGFATLISENENVAVQMQKIKGMVMLVAETYALTVDSIKRARKFAPTTVNETEALAIAVTRTRKVAALIAETEAMLVALARNRPSAWVVAELETISTQLARLRGMSLTVNETETFAFVFNKLKNLSMAIAETETMTVSLSRTLRMALLISEMESVAANFNRKRGLAPTVVEQEQANALLARARQSAFLIPEFESMTAALGRIRSVGFNWTETESVAIHLAKLKYMSMLISESLNTQFGALQRVRSLAAVLPEHASYLAALQRVRNMGTLITEHQTVSVDYKRFRGIVTNILETQGVTAGSLRRLRGFAADIVETYGCDIRLSVYMPEPTRFVVTASFEQWEEKLDGTLNLQTKSMSWEVSRVPDLVACNIPVGETVTLNIPYSPTQTLDIGDLLAVGIELPGENQ